MAEGSPAQQRYVIASEIATGGMATVYLGRMRGAVGFARTVAIKKLHPQYAKDPEFVGMFVDEARLAARIQHPNVVQTLDVVVSSGEVLLVMEYIAGETLSRISRAVSGTSEKIPVRIACTIVAAALHGLHAAHEASDESGDNLNIVHRDVSPQNIVVGADGVPRVLDFGVAKAVSRMQTTGEGQVKGKLAYMAPEQLLSLPISRAADIFSAGVVLWEVLTGERLLKAQNEGELVKRLLDAKFMPPSLLTPGLPPALDEIALKALDRTASNRYATAREMAQAIERAAGTASSSEIADWLRSVVGPSLDERAAAVRTLERRTTNKLTVDNVIDSVRESRPSMLAALETETDIIPVKFEGDPGSFTGKPVTSPSFPSQPSLVTPRRSRVAIPLVIAAVALLGGGSWLALRRTSVGSAVSAAPPPSALPSVPTPSAEPRPPVTAPEPAVVSAIVASAAPAAAPPTRVGGRAPARASAPPPKTAETAAAPPKPADPWDSLGGRR